jgi:hypothetical protein
MRTGFSHGSQRVLHCMESPEHWFEDFGTAKLKNGRALVALEADFAKVIKRSDYRVFVTPEGDCQRALRGAARAPRASRCASLRAASRTSRSPIASSADAGTSEHIAASPTSIRALSSPPAPRAGRASARLAQQSCAHSSPGWRRKRESARQHGRCEAEDPARLQAGHLDPAALRGKEEMTKVYPTVAIARTDLPTNLGRYVLKATRIAIAFSPAA